MADVETQQAAAPPVNPATVAAHLDTAWRIVGAEQVRREGLERTASSIATFSSVVISLSVALGVKLANVAGAFGPVLYGIALAALLASVGAALWVLLPRPYDTLGLSYVERFPSWSEITKPTMNVQGETIRGLVATVRSSQERNQANAGRVFWALVLLMIGVSLLAVEAVMLAIIQYQ